MSKLPVQCRVAPVVHTRPPPGDRTKRRRERNVAPLGDELGGTRSKVITKPRERSVAPRLLQNTSNLTYRSWLEPNAAAKVQDSVVLPRPFLRSSSTDARTLSSSPLSTGFTR